MSMIVKKMLESSYVTGQDLIKGCALTKRQIDYSLDKLNDWLEACEREPIQILTNQIEMSESTRKFLETSLFGWEKYHLSAKERILYIFLMIISAKEFLSINHFIDALDVSKSSIAKDLKELAKDLEISGSIQLLYSRKRGYYLQGEEGRIRSYLIRQIMLAASIGNNRLLDLFIEENKESERHEKLKQVMNDLLKKYELNFAANRLKEFMYSFIFLEKRLISYPDYIPRENDFSIGNTVEFQLANELIHYFKLPELCIEFLSVWLLGITEIDLNKVEKDNSIGINLVEDLLIRFEYLSGIYFENRELVKKQIHQHFRPAHYRLLFNIPIVNPLLERIKKEYEELFIIVKEAMKYYETQFMYFVPEDEIAFLVIHFASLIQKYQGDANKKIKVAVTCPNGIGSSMILYTQLKEIFPEFDFLSPTTHMDLKLLFSEVDIIFSTTRHNQLLPPGKTFFIVNPVMNLTEKSRLKKEVYSVLGKTTNRLLDLNQVMSIVQKHVDTKTSKNIEKNLNQVVFDCETDIKKNSTLKPFLHEIIQDDFIKLNVDASDRFEAVRIAAHPLFEAGVITEDYIEKMLISLEQGTEYMVISKHIAMPHGKIEDGSLKLGIGITTLSTPIEFGNKQNDPVKYIFTLSAIDKKSHLQALSSLVSLISCPNFHHILETATDGKEILNFIEKFEAN